MDNALIVVDVQRDFAHPKGSLYVASGEQIAIDILSYIDVSKNNKFYARYLATKDSHNPNSDNCGHISSTPDYIDSWPKHCLTGKPGANFMKPLRSDDFNDTFKKGRGVPAYSGFQGVGTFCKLTLNEYLRTYGINRVDICGLALDYCVKQTAIDAAKEGFKTRVFRSLTAAVDPARVADVVRELETFGVKVV